MSIADSLLSSPDPVTACAAHSFFEKKDSPALHKTMLADPRVQALLADVNKWPGLVVNSHKSAGALFHKLAFLADIGLSIRDNNVGEIVKKITARRDENGVPCLIMNISEAYGGSGSDEPAWALCDAPTVLYSLARLGFEDKLTEKAVAWLASLVRDNGWGCAVSPALGNWRGPGKKSDPCPYATLIMVKLLAQQKNNFQKEIETGMTSLLSLWKNSRTEHPYIFYMGTDFRKLKAPFIWYDILHVLEAASLWPGAKKNKQVQEMLSIVISKKTDDGYYIPESVYQPWKDWDFGQKKKPSLYMTLCAMRIEERLTGKSAV